LTLTWAVMDLSAVLSSWWISPFSFTIIASFTKSTSFDTWSKTELMSWKICEFFNGQFGIVVEILAYFSRGCWLVHYRVLLRVHHAIHLQFDISSNTYIISHPFPIGVGRDHFLPLATVLTHTFRFLHFHQIPRWFRVLLTWPFSKTSPIWSRNVFPFQRYHPNAPN
jgi:hypothetical protein